MIAVNIFAYTVYVQYDHMHACIDLCMYSVVLYSIEVEDSYNGPKLEGDINPEFMKDLLKWFKEQKRLHKKYCYKVCVYVE